jgi:hypothetical protein
MSMGFRIGGSYINPKRPKDWQLNLFAIFVFLPIALVFAAGCWCLVFARAISRPLHNTKPDAPDASVPAQRLPE